MLKYRASGTGGPGAARGRWRGDGAAALLVVAGLAAWVATVLVRVQRLRRTAASHASDLERTGAVGSTVGEPIRLVVLGDSAARGYGLTEAGHALPHQLAGRVAAATRRGVAVTSMATDGHRTADVLAQQAPDLPAVRPDAVVVSVGVNDAIGRTPDRQLATATRELLTRVLGAAGDHAVVVLVPCPDLSVAPGFPRPLNRAVGWRGRRVARVQRAVADDLGVPVARLPRPDATMFGPDGFHPGAAGHAAMADVVARALLAHAPATWGVAPPTEPPKEQAWT